MSSFSCSYYYSDCLLFSAGDDACIDGITTVASTTNNKGGSTSTSNAEEKTKTFEQQQQDFNAHLEESVKALLADCKMDVDKKSRKRDVTEANEPSEAQGLLSNEQMADMVKNSRFYQGEDDGLQIPELHPFYNLPITLQMLILDLPADRLDGCLDYIEKIAPKKETKDEDEDL